MAGSPHLAYFAEDEGRLTDQWGYLIRANGLVGRAYCIGESYDRRVTHVGAITDLPDLPIVFVTLAPDAEPLKTFQHPTECVYLFGPSNRNLTPSELEGRTIAAKIAIPSADGTELFAAQAGAVVLWDREVKGG
jgi:hypothetical protein